MSYDEYGSESGYGTDTGYAGTGYESGYDTGGGEHAAAPPEVVLSGEAGFDPAFPKVNHEIQYYWSETNIGGPHDSDYHARVEWKDPDGNFIDTVDVDCSALATNEQAQRSCMLSAPTEAKMGYTIELYVDVDHHGQYSEGYNYAYHNVNVDD